MKEYIIEVADNGMVTKVGQELVRCKDCKWYDPFPMCKLLGTSDNRPDFFCADGEVKDNA